MRFTYTDLLNNFVDNTQNRDNIADSTLLGIFNRSLTSRYQLMLSILSNYTAQASTTFSTAATTQYYANPTGQVDIENIVITVGSLNYPLQALDSQDEWDRLNSVLLSPTATPQYFFPRRDDFGIWPIPQATYSGTINYHYRDKSLTNADYTMGTLAVTTASAAVVGTGTTFTAGMVGRWLQVTTDGYWYRVAAFTDTTHITLASNYTGVTGSGLSYRIGETPELPAETHGILSDGILAEYWQGVRGNTTKAAWYENKFWTGQGDNVSRNPTDVLGGLIGASKRYSQRSNSGIIERRDSALSSPNDKLWASSISS